jgi:hypothetical protein
MEDIIEKDSEAQEDQEMTQAEKAKGLGQIASPRGDIKINITN